MIEFPLPLTPPDCDLRDFAFMPLDVVRLRDSDISAISSGDEFRCAVLIWCASWHQVPASSIPDEDIILAQLAGFGRVVKEWKKVKEGALRGWIKCADGRLYHPVVAEKANEAWRAKLEQRWKTECARIKKQNQRNGTSLQFPTFEEFLLSPNSALCPEGQIHDVPRDKNEISEDKSQCPSGNGIQGTGRGTGTVINTTPPHSAQVGESFRMQSGWQPSPHFGELARQAGLMVPGTEEFKAALGEFIAYWLTQNRSRTQHEWDHALVKNLKADKLRVKPATVGKRQPKPENFEGRDYGQGGPL